MSDIRTQFAFTITGWPSAAVDHLFALADAVNALGDERPIPEDTPEDLAEFAREVVDMYLRGTDAQMERDSDDDVIIWAESHGCVGAVADIIGHAMAAHGIAKPVVIEYANTCSQMWLGEFGGGAVVIGADRQEWIDTASWAKDMAARMEASIPAGEAKVEPLSFDDVSCTNASEYGTEPASASFTIDRSMAERIIAIAATLDELDMWKAETFDRHCHWAAPEDHAFADEDGEIRTEADVLCVSKSHFWFEAVPKHEDSSIACEEQSIADLALHFGFAFPAVPAPVAVIVKGGLVEAIHGCGHDALVLDLDTDGIDPGRVRSVVLPDGSRTSATVQTFPSKPAIRVEE